MASRAFDPSDFPGKKFVKDFKPILKDMEQGIRQVRPLWNGRDLQNFSLRLREVLSLWLICVSFHRLGKSGVTFGEDDETDGILVDLETRTYNFVENVAAMDFPNTQLEKGENRVLNAIKHKIELGESYASEKILVVFFDGAGRFEPNKIAKEIDGKHAFENIFLVGLLTDKNGTEYTYAVIELVGQGSNMLIVTINPTFTGWEVVSVNDPKGQSRINESINYLKTK